MSDHSTQPQHPSLPRVGLICAAVAVLIRCAWFWSVKDEAFLYAHVQDSALYHELALRIMSDGLPLDSPFSVAPLYAFLLASVYGVTGVDPTAVYVLQIALAGATVFLTARLGARLFGRPGAWSGGLVTALYPVAIIYDVRLLSVGVGSFLTIAAASLVHHAWVSRQGRKWMAAGVALGLAALVRGNMLIVAPAICIVSLWRGGVKSALLTALGFWLSVGPVTWHNHAASGEFIPISLGGGINLYRGNNPYFVDRAVHPFRLPAQRDGLLKKSQLIASIELDTELTPTQTDRFWTLRTLKVAADTPGRALALVVRKGVQVLSPAEIGDHMDLDAAIIRSPVLKWIPPLYAPVVLLGVLGLIMTRKHRDGALAAMLVMTLGSVALFFVVSRYRVPMVSLFAIYAGGGMGWWWRTYRGRSRARWVCGVGLTAAVATVIFMPLLHPSLPWNVVAGDAREGEACAVDQHTRHAPEVESQFEVGVFALNHGQLADAEEAMWAVLRLEPEHTPAGVNLSWLLLQKGADEAALGVAARVVETDPCDDKAWANLAQASSRLGDKTRALDAARRAARIDPYNPGYWMGLGEAMLATGNRDGARTQFERMLKWEPDTWQAHARLGQLALESGDYLQASTHLQKAVKVRPNRVELVGMLGLSEIGRGNREGAQKLLKAAVRSGMRGPALTALAKALSSPGG